MEEEFNEKEFEKQEGVEFWKPTEEGQYLQGEIKEIDKEGTYGYQYTIETIQGKVFITPSHRVLQNRMRKVEKGDIVRIEYLGEEDSKQKGYDPMRMYEVYIKKKE